MTYLTVMDFTEYEAPVTILVVEDDPDIGLLLDELLRNDGFSVHSVRTGREGLAYLREHIPSLIVLDALVPDMPGWDFDAVKCADPRVEHVPVVVTTGLPEKDLRPASIRAVARLPKPYRIEALLDLVRRHAKPLSPTFDPTAITVDLTASMMSRLLV